MRVDSALGSWPLILLEPRLRYSRDFKAEIARGSRPLMPDSYNFSPDRADSLEIVEGICQTPRDLLGTHQST